EIVSFKRAFLHLMILTVAFRPASAYRLLSRSSQRRVRFTFTSMPVELIQSACKIQLSLWTLNFVSNERDDEQARRGNAASLSTSLGFRKALLLPSQQQSDTFLSHARASS